MKTIHIPSRRAGRALPLSISSFRTSCRNALLGAILSMSAAEAWDGPIGPQAWADLKSQVEGKKAQLESLISQAESSGHDVERAFVSKVTLDVFLNVAQWDYDNPDALEDIYDSYPINRYYDSGDHLRQSFEQLSDCLDVADYAMTELNEQLNGTLNLAPTVNVFEAHKVVEDSNFKMDGRVVFPVRMGVPAGTNGARAYGAFGSGFHFFRNLQSNLKIAQGVKNNTVNGINSDNAKFHSPIMQFYGNTGGLPSWMVNGPYGIVRTPASYTIYEGGRNFVNYDISNPNIQSWLGALADDLVPAMVQANNSSGGVSMIHMLANEPHFSVRRNGWRVNDGGFSPFMIDGFRTWLQNKYQNVNNLNAAHNANYSSFASYPVNVPLDPGSMLGTPGYYEYARYNLDRVNGYFDLLKESVKRNDASALTTIKLLGGMPISGNKTDGIDTEYLTRMMDVTGSDYEAVPDTAFFFNNAPDRIANDSWLANYSFYWSIGTQFLDFAKSINPDAPHFNSEWHGISTGSWRDFNMSREYVRAALWIQYTHGLNLLETWWWGRNSDGSIKGSSSIGAMGTQPIVVDEHARAVKEVNAHSETVAALAAQDRFAHVYHSVDAKIQSPSIGRNTGLVYESMKLLNYSVGMVSRTMVSGLDPAKDFIVIPPMPFMPLNELNALNNFKNAGGRVVVFEESGETFAGKNELGIQRSNIPFQPSNTLSYVDDPAELANRIAAVSSDLVPERSLPFQIKDLSDEVSYGVLVQEAIDTENQTTAVFMINVSKEPLVVNLGLTQESRDNRFTNLLTGQAAGYLNLLEPMEVILLKASPRSKTLAPARDTFVRGERHANENHGLSDSLICKFYGGNANRWTRRIFTQFELGDFDGNRLANARLRLKVKSRSSGSVTHSIHAVADDSWFQSTMTWNNQPSYGQLLDQKPSANAGQWIEFDVTDQVRAELLGDGVFSSAILSSGNPFVTYHSREAADPADRPQLIMTESNSAPVWSQSLVEDAGLLGNAGQVTLRNYVSDPDGDGLVFSITSGPAWLNVTPDGRLYGYPGPSNLGTSTWTIEATDQVNAPVSGQIRFNISSNQIQIAEDSFVRGGARRNTNYGSDSVLSVKLDPNNELYTREIFLKYDLSALDGKGIGDAKLRLKLKSTNGSVVGHSVQVVEDDSWQEGSITWANRPSIRSGNNPLIPGVLGSDQWTEFDLRELVATEYLRDGVLTLKVSSNSIFAVSYHSSEASANDRPQLRVSVAD